jgi:two-component system, OmpR family, response regulator
MVPGFRHGCYPPNLLDGKDIWSGYRRGASFGFMSGEAVLVVEHEVPSREFLAQQLTDDGFEVFAADGAGKALELVEAERPDLVLLDAVLPDSSGFELCSRLREGKPGHAWNRDVPVIMVSARGDPVDRVRGFARGADDYVVKPFVYEELVARMRAVLRRVSGPRHAQLSVRDLEMVSMTGTP